MCTTDRFALAVRLVTAPGLIMHCRRLWPAVSGGSGTVMHAAQMGAKYH